METGNNDPGNGPRADSICFGLSRDLDEQSLVAFLSRFANPALRGALVPRMSDKEIDELVATLTGIMHRHLKKKEYHLLFLGEK